MRAALTRLNCNLLSGARVGTGTMVCGLMTPCRTAPRHGALHSTTTPSVLQARAKVTTRSSSSASASRSGASADAPSVPRIKCRPFSLVLIRSRPVPAAPCYTPLPPPLHPINANVSATHSRSVGLYLILASLSASIPRVAYLSHKFYLLRTCPRPDIAICRPPPVLARMSSYSLHCGLICPLTVCMRLRNCLSQATGSFFNLPDTQLMWRCRYVHSIFPVWPPPRDASSPSVLTFQFNRWPQSLQHTAVSAFVPHCVPDYFLRSVRSL